MRERLRDTILFIVMVVLMSMGFTVLLRILFGGCQ